MDNNNTQEQASDHILEVYHEAPNKKTDFEESK